jgi:hypothetical protein
LSNSRRSITWLPSSVATISKCNVRSSYELRVEQDRTRAIESGGRIGQPPVESEIWYRIGKQQIKYCPIAKDVIIQIWTLIHNSPPGSSNRLFNLQ